MKQKTFSISIENPCHEKWSDMASAEQGKFCAACQKKVVDYSGMSDRQIIDALSGPANTGCGRFHNTQLNRLMVPATISRKPFLASVLGGLLALFSLKPEEAGAQQQPVAITANHPATVSQTIKDDSLASVIHGRVLNVQDTLPVAGAVIQLNKSEALTVISDENGYFSLSIPDSLVHTDIRLSIIHIEYMSYERIMKANDVTRQEEFFLDPYIEITHTVGIICYPEPVRKKKKHREE